MKKTTYVITSTFAAFLLASCATTQEITAEPATVEVAEAAEPKQLIVQESPEDIFIKSLEGITIKSVSSPKEVYRGRSFAAPFVFEVKNADGEPVENLSITLSYPSSKSVDEGISFEKTEILTDSDGKITFTAEPTAFAAKTKVTVYPTPINESEELIERLKPFTAEADWKVKSDIVSKGAVLFVWDFNEKDRPINNFSNLQAEFRTRGITMVGNGPVNETSYLGKQQSLYKDTFKIIGGKAYGYLIYGTIKFDQPVTAKEDGSGYFCVMKADIEAFDMKNGNKVYSFTTSYESNGKNWNECVSKGKDKIAEYIVTDIIYGL